MTTNKRVVFEDERMRISRQGSKGKGHPPKIQIEVFGSVGVVPEHIPDRRRLLEVTIDELFDLTEALDDICDHIEDHG